MSWQGSGPRDPLPGEDEPVDLEDHFPPKGFIQGQSSIPGIDVFLPGELGEKRPEVVDFKCPQCGATIAYDVAQGGLACEYCGYTKPVEETRLGRAAAGFEFKVETLERSEKGWGEARKEMACQRCGGVISTPPDVLAFACPFCGSNKVLLREPLEDVLRPRYLLPFKVSPQDCGAGVQKWLGSSWMLPPGLREQARIEKYNPLYIPYWTFSARGDAVWKAQVAHEVVEHHTVNGRTEETRRIEWREEAGKVQKGFSDLLVPGTGHLNLSVLARVDRYNLADLILYEPAHLAGMNAQAYDLPLEEAWDAARQIMRENIRKACLDHASSTNVRNFTMTLDFCDEEWRYILAPLYTSVYQYQNKPYQVLINGQSGKIAGPRPVDWEKVWLVVAALLAPGVLMAVLGWLFSTGPALPPATLIGLLLFITGMVFAFIIIANGRGIEHD